MLIFCNGVTDICHTFRVRGENADLVERVGVDFLQQGDRIRHTFRVWGEIFVDFGVD